MTEELIRVLRIRDKLKNTSKKKNTRHWISEPDVDDESEDGAGKNIQLNQI